MLDGTLSKLGHGPEECCLENNFGQPGKYPEKGITTPTGAHPQGRCVTNGKMTWNGFTKQVWTLPAGACHPAFFFAPNPPLERRHKRRTVMIVERGVIPGWKVAAAVLVVIGVVCVLHLTGIEP
jgi:hypothetical protein